MEGIQSGNPVLDRCTHLNVDSVKHIKIGISVYLQFAAFIDYKVEECYDIQT